MGFSHFSTNFKKVRRWARTRGRNCSPSRAHPPRQLMWTPGSSPCMGRFGRSCCRTTCSGTRRGNVTDGSTAALGCGSGGYRLCDPSATSSSSLRRTVDGALFNSSAEWWFLPFFLQRQVVDIPVMAQLQTPLDRLPLRFPSCSTMIRCSMSLLRRSSRFVRSRGRRSRSHSCSSFSLEQVVARPLCATTSAHGR